MNILIKQSINICGGQTSLARAINARQQDVWNWLNDKYLVSPRYVIQIERATNGAVTRYDLRPDIYPPEEKPISTTNGA